MNGCHLPPSIDIRDSGFRLRSIYSIKAIVKQGRFCGVPRTKRVVQNLPFSCSDVAIAPLPFSSITSLPADNVFTQWHFSSSVSTVENIRNGFLPLYSPALQVELVMPQPPILIRGHTTLVKLILRTPVEMLQSGNLYVRSIGIKVLASVTTYLELSPRQLRNSSPGSTIHGVVRIDKEELELDLGAWGGLLVVDFNSTFETCSLHVSHSIEIGIGISQGLEGNIHVGFPQSGSSSYT